MIQKYILNTLSVALLLLPGCTTLKTGTDTNGAPPIVTQVAKSTMSWDGTPLPAYLKGQPEITILRIIIPPGTRLPMHRHPVINAGVLLSGQLTVVSKEGETLHLNSGDSIVELVNKWHYGINEGTAPAEIIVFYAGVPGIPITLIEPH